jgi:glycosyltransferase involved in cell wall biosynthesis
MPSDVPLVTIGMPSYNKAPYIAEAIESILAQTHTNLELLISDDRSTDESASICETYAKRDSRIRFVSQPTNLGMIPNFDFVLNEARGEYFMWFSADDRVDPTWLEACLAACAEGGVIGFGQVADVYEDGTIKRRYPLSPVTGSRMSRVVSLYWTMLQECNMLHGVTRTDRVRRMGGLAPYAFAGIAFDFLYVWESAFQGELLARPNVWLYKRDSINNNVLQRGGKGALLRHALWPSVPIWRVMLFHRTRMPATYRLLLATMFLPRCVYALGKWYAKGFELAFRRRRTESATL